MGEQSSGRMVEEGCPVREAAAAGLCWHGCQVGKGGGLDREKGMARRRETWRRREKLKGCERPWEAAPAAGARIPHYWGKRGGFGELGILQEIGPQVKGGWGGCGRLGVLAGSVVMLKRMD